MKFKCLTVEKMMKKWNTLTSAAMLAACSANAQALPPAPTAQEMYQLAKQQPSINVPEDVVQDMLQKHQCELVEGEVQRYRCQVTIAYYRETGDVVLDKQELLLSWKDGQWQR